MQYHAKTLGSKRRAGAFTTLMEKLMSSQLLHKLTPDHPTGVAALTSKRESHRSSNSD